VAYSIDWPNFIYRMSGLSQIKNEGGFLTVSIFYPKRTRGVCQGKQLFVRIGRKCHGFESGLLTNSSRMKTALVGGNLLRGLVFIVAIQIILFCSPEDQERAFYIWEDWGESQPLRLFWVC
jgi:hypothetical protein